MSLGVEALYLYDDQHNCILEHVYHSRPASPKSILTQYRLHSVPRPAILYLQDLSPPTIVASVSHSNILFICPTSTDQNALALLEFIYRVIDIFEDFLGAPLLAQKIESNYDVVAQLLNEMCDGGVICNTEPNALRENVEITSTIGKLLNQVGLPGSAPSLGPSNNLAATLKAQSSLNSGPAIPWRKSNVRHTSNEIYVDLLESISIILAPSGRPISAISSGSIAFTAKISGVPDMLLTLSAPGGSSSGKASSIARTIQAPVFHPCVRLTRWKEHPGDLSFVPPDGRFVLGAYEVDLLPPSTQDDALPLKGEKFFLPATVDLRTGLGEKGTDFEARLTLNTNFPGFQNSAKHGPGTGRGGAHAPAFSFGSSSAGSSNAPSLEAVSVSIPIPEAVHTVTDIRPTRGEAHFQQFERNIIWKVPTKDGASVNGTATLTGRLSGPISAGDDDEELDEEDPQSPATSNALLGYYDDDVPKRGGRTGEAPEKKKAAPASQQRRSQASRALAPRSVAVSFVVRGWLPSGIKVDSLAVVKGGPEGVKPFKGVKYITVSRRGLRGGSLVNEL